MLDLAVTVWGNLQDYVFGSNVVMVSVIMAFLFGFMIYNGFSVDTMIGMTLLGSMVMVGWFLPSWVLTVVLIIAGTLIAIYFGRKVV